MAGYGGLWGLRGLRCTGYGGFGYAPGGIGMSGVGYWNPMFGVGLTPLGTQSYMMETRLLGRVPRASARYYAARPIEGGRQPSSRRPLGQIASWSFSP